MSEKKKRPPVYLFLWASLILIIAAVVLALTMLLLYKLHVTEEEATMVVICAAAALAAVSAVLSVLMSRAVLHPIRRISEASRQVATGDFDVNLEYTGSIRDIRDTYESINTMAKELSGIETLRSDFIANVSHEFKTPLTAIEGYAMLLQDESLPRSERQECLEKILSGVGRLSDLVSNILMLSKLEQEKVRARRAPFRLDEQIRQAILSLEPLWSEKELVLEPELEEMRYNGSESLLYHVWSNLLSNAVKFSPVGGKLTVTLWAEGEKAICTVTDEGPGMSEETQKHIFEKFYQGDFSRGQDGSGLGLPLAKRIVELSGGTVQVESAPGKGSTFRVVLPR